MRYSIWRISAEGDAFQITSAGNTTNKEVALEKADNLNKKLISSEPDTEDRFVVRDENGKEIKVIQKKEDSEAEEEPVEEPTPKKTNKKKTIVKKVAKKVEKKKKPAKTVKKKKQSSRAKKK